LKQDRWQVSLSVQNIAGKSPSAATKLSLSWRRFTEARVAEKVPPDQPEEIVCARDLEEKLLGSRSY
jgi:hypothetical protein